METKDGSLRKQNPFWCIQMMKNMPILSKKSTAPLTSITD